jgi:type IV pilus assembly protein PilM
MNRRGIIQKIFSKKSLGVSLSSSSAAFVLVSGTESLPRLETVSSRPLLPGTLHPSLRDRNILNPQGFLVALKEARNGLGFRGKYVSLSLPDSVGRVMILDMEERFKNRSEGLDVIRWKLKKKLPFDPADAQLDYQSVAKRENGDMVVLVAMVLRPVISQYEELFAAADLVPTRIDLNSFNLCRVFERRMADHDDYAFLTLYDSNLGIMFFAGGKPEFVRFRELAGGETVHDSLHNEIRCSFLSYKERFPERVLKNVFCVSPPRTAGYFSGVARDAIGCEPVLLETKTALYVKESIPSDPESLFPFTTAIGAALRAL